MTDREALLAACRYDPSLPDPWSRYDDDTPRLMLADELELGSDGDRARAEFIRVQCELAKMPPRKRIERDERISPVVSPSRGGPDYCEFVTWEEEGLQAGDRVDVLGPKGWRYGLLVRRIEQLPGFAAGESVAVCKIDEQSVPDPASELRRRERDLWERFAPHFAAGAAAQTIGIPLLQDFSRGFLSRVRCSWADCAAHLDAILADPWVPGLDEVELTTWPDTMDLYRLNGGDSPGNLIERHKEIISRRWPAVRSWKLPPEPMQNYGMVTPDEFSRDFRITRAMFDTGPVVIPPRGFIRGPV